MGNQTLDFNSSASHGSTDVLLDSRATPGETTRAGIRQNAGGVGVSPSLPASAKNSKPSAITTTNAITTSPTQGSRVLKKREKKARRLARHYYHMKKAGSYLDYMQYYNDDEYGEATGILEHCHTSWSRERKGENIRYRANGCGRRFDCPLCGNYVQSQLAMDASGNMEQALTALDVASVNYDSYGLKLIFTIPKETSAWIDELIFNDNVAWVGEVNRLFKEVASVVKRWFGPGVGYLMSLELTGESNPTEPHYHISVYVFPARYENGRWYLLESYTNKLDVWRADWTAVVNRLYGLSLNNADFRYSFLGTIGQMRHWHRYMYRPILADLWRGWVDYDGVGLTYAYRRNRQRNELYIQRDDLSKAFDRARYIPKHFKRLRWGGILSDGLRAKTMETILGLDRVEKEDSDTSKAEGWERDVDVFRLVRYEDAGIVLRNIDTDEIFFVPDNFLDYRPNLVKTGRRVKWREPGATYRDDGEKLVLDSDTLENLVLHSDLEEIKK